VPADRKTVGAPNDDIKREFYRWCHVLAESVPADVC
jgi:hypothetical protein